MPSRVSNNINIIARKNGFVFLLLLVLSLFAVAMAANSMHSMGAHDMSVAPAHDMSAHDMSAHDESFCASMVLEDCASNISEHNHQNCVDNHCNSFSGLLVDYDFRSEVISSINPISSLGFYVSAHSKSPYFPPIVHS